MKNFLLGLLVLTFVVGCGSRDTTTDSATKPAAAANKQQYLQEGIQYLKQANPRDAIKSFDEAIKQNPTDPSSYIVLGETYLRLNRFDRAIDTFSAALRVSPTNGHLYYLLAMAYGLSGDMDQAKLNAEKSIVLFQQQKDAESLRQSVALLKGLLDTK